MKDFLDFTITVLFVLFMIWLIVGYHRQKGHHLREENLAKKDSDEATTTD